MLTIGGGLILAATADGTLPPACNVGSTVLGKNGCAEWFFDDGGSAWNYNTGEYDSTVSGATNMLAGSQFHYSGTTSGTKYSIVQY